MDIAEIARWLYPNVTSLAMGEPPRPIPSMPTTPGKVQGTDDPRIGSSMLEVVDLLSNMAPGKAAVGAGIKLGAGLLSPAMKNKLPRELWHVVGPDYVTGQPLQSLYRRHGNKAYDMFAQKWPEAGNLGEYHAHRNFFYDNMKEAEEHADVFGGRVMKIDPKKVGGLYLDTLEKSYKKPGFWATAEDVPPEALKFIR